MDKILEIRDLVLRFYTYEGIIKALEGVDLEVAKGETMGLVGETGSGKTVTAFSILRLIPSPGRIERGEIFFQTDRKRINLLEQDPAQLQRIRGKAISMIFQEPGSALNPLYTVKDQIAEDLLLHRRDEFLKRTLKNLESELRQKEGNIVLSIQRALYQRILENPDATSIRLIDKIPLLKRYRRRLNRGVHQEVIKILQEMDIPDPERVADLYPHELSGGMKQRVVIGMALACNPSLLLADEPTTALDVTVQAQVLSLLKKLKDEFGASVLYITHDMGIVAEICDRVTVMYAGAVCEVASVKDIFKEPLHPYTQALLAAIPRPEEGFHPIPGTIPSLIDPPTGCRFHPRCPYAMVGCQIANPEPQEVEEGHFVACYLF